MQVMAPPPLEVQLYAAKGVCLFTLVLCRMCDRFVLMVHHMLTLLLSIKLKVGEETTRAALTVSVSPSFLSSCWQWCQKTKTKNKQPLIHKCIVDGRRGDGSESLMHHWHVVTATLTHCRLCEWVSEWGLPVFLMRCESELRARTSWNHGKSPGRVLGMINCSCQCRTSPKSPPTSAALIPFTGEGWRLCFPVAGIVCVDWNAAVKSAERLKKRRATHTWWGFEQFDSSRIKYSAVDELNWHSKRETTLLLH